MRRPVLVRVALVALAFTTRGGHAAVYDDGSGTPYVAGGEHGSVIGGNGHHLGLGLGPGSDPWRVGDAQSHGVSPESLAETIGSMMELPGRSCLVVVRDGEIIGETYDTRWGVDKDTTARTDSVGAIATVALVGAAVTKGLFALDVPLVMYGLQESVFPVFGAVHGLKVTPRHLLSQTHGGGEVAPGIVFRVDDDPKFVGLLFSLIEKTSGASVENFASAVLGTPLGIDTGTMFNGVKRTNQPYVGNIETVTSTFKTWYSGGQIRTTCRDVAKLAQLFLNAGRWIDGGTNRPVQILSPKFTREAFSSAMNFPNANKAFGLLAWSHDPLVSSSLGSTGSESHKSGNTEHSCCAPVTSARACGESAKGLPSHGLLFGKTVTEKVDVFLGNRGSAIFMLSERNALVVSLGRTVFGTETCRAEAASVLGDGDGGTTNGAAKTSFSDDYALLKLLWGAVSPVARPGGVGVGKQSEPFVGGRDARYDVRGVGGTSTARSTSGGDAKVTVSRDTRAESHENAEADASSNAVRDLVQSAFEDSFRAAVGGVNARGGDLPLSTYSRSESPRFDPSTAIDPKYQLHTDAAYEFPTSTGTGNALVDAEVVRLTNAKARWYADVSVRLSQQELAQRTSYEKKLSTLEKTQSKYKAAYQNALAEIAEAASMEKALDRRERQAAGKEAAVAWRESQIAEQQQLREARLDAREQEVAKARVAFSDALVDARAHQGDTFGVGSWEPSWEESWEESSEQSSEQSSEDFSKTVRQENPDANAEASFFSRREVGAISKRKKSDRLGSDTVSKPTRGADVPGRWKKDDTPPRVFNMRDMDFVRVSVHGGKGEQTKRPYGHDEKLKTAGPKKRKVDSPPAATPSADSNDRRVVLPISHRASAEADDFLADLAPGSQKKLKARLGALAAFDAELRAVLDDPVREHKSSLDDGTTVVDDDSENRNLAKNPLEDKSNENPAANIFAQWPTVVSSAVTDDHLTLTEHDDVSQTVGTVPHETRSATETKKPYARLGARHSVWSWIKNSVASVGGAKNAIDESTNHGACLCECPGASSMGASQDDRVASDASDACFDIDLSLVADADGPSACVRVERGGAGAGSCPTTGMVNRCEALSESVDDDAAEDATESYTSEVTLGSDSGGTETSSVKLATDRRVSSKPAMTPTKATKKASTKTTNRASIHSSKSSKTSSETSSRSPETQPSHSRRANKNALGDETFRFEKVRSVSRLGRAWDDSVDDGLVLDDSRSEGYSQSSSYLGYEESVGDYVCRQTKTCGALGTETSATSATSSFLVEVYACDAKKFAACRWVPGKKCGGSKAVTTSVTKSVSRTVTNQATNQATNYDPSLLPSVSSQGAFAGDGKPETFGFAPTRRLAGVRDWSPSHQFLAGGSFVIVAIAAIAQARRTLVQRGTHKHKSKLRGVPTYDDSELDSDEEGGDEESGLLAVKPSTKKPPRGFGADAVALTKGVWAAFGGEHSTVAAEERRPILSDTKRGGKILGTKRDTTPGTHTPLSEPKQTRPPKQISRVKRKVVFDVVEEHNASDVADDFSDFAESPDHPGASATLRAEAAAALVSAQKKTARLERARVAREDAELREKSVGKKSIRLRVEGDTRSRPVPLPAPANAAKDTGVPNAFRV